MSGGVCFSHTNRRRKSVLWFHTSIQRLCKRDSCVSSGKIVIS